MPRFLCLSDTHGHLPDLSKYDFDAVLLAGDFTPDPTKAFVFQHHWLDGPFHEWLTSVGKPVIATPGNHDFIFQDAPQQVPADLPWVCLQDRETTFDRLLIYGTPWQPTFPVPRPGFKPYWAFNADEPELCRRWANIPVATDVLIVHGPPHGAGDRVQRVADDGKFHVGSPGLRRRIEEVQPKLVVCGHIHPGYGVHRIGETIVVNASHLDDGYREIRQPIIVEVEI